MKKIFLIIVMTSIVATTWAQQLSTIRGKTKDNKTLTVQYYPGTFEDRIESVKYQVVDELQNNVKTLQNNVKDLQNNVKTLQGNLNEANKQINHLNNELKKSSAKGQNNQVALSQQLEAKEAEIAQLTRQIDSLATLIEQTDLEKNHMKRLLDSITSTKVKEPKPEKPATTAKSTFVVGIEAAMGPTVFNTGLDAPWAKNITWNKQVAVYFGTPRFTESFPLSAEVGIGANQLPISASIYQYNTQIEGWEDNDGDICTAHYSFDNLSEKLTMTSIGIPVRLCFGQPIKNKTSVYAKLGVTPSLLLVSTFSRQGKYSLKGEYPQWDVILENIEELGYHTDAEFDGKTTKVKPQNMFNLWGNLALGAYIPMGSTLLLNMGLKLDYPIIVTNSFDAADGSNLDIQGWDGLLNRPQKSLIASFEIGIVINLK